MYSIDIKQLAAEVHVISSTLLLLSFDSCAGESLKETVALARTIYPCPDK